MPTPRCRRMVTAGRSCSPNGCVGTLEDFGMQVRVFRFHNVYGSGTWDGGPEKAPAAICRKIIEAERNGSYEIEVWATARQTRSFMYIDDRITGIDKLMASDYPEPLNLSLSELVSINQLVDLVSEISGRGQTHPQPVRPTRCAAETRTTP